MYVAGLMASCVFHIGPLGTPHSHGRRSAAPQRLGHQVPLRSQVRRREMLRRGLVLTGIVPSIWSTIAIDVEIRSTECEGYRVTLDPVSKRRE